MWKKSKLWSGIFSPQQHENHHLVVLNCPPYLLWSCSDSSQLPPQSAHLPNRLRLGAAPCRQERRMHHLLRPGGGHRHLHLRPHVSVQRLRPQTEETVQCVLPHLPEAHQRCHQNIQAITVRVFKLVLLLLRPTAGCHPCLTLRFGPTFWIGDQPSPNITVPIHFWKEKKKNPQLFLEIDSAVKARYKDYFLLANRILMCTCFLSGVSSCFHRWTANASCAYFCVWLMCAEYAPCSALDLSHRASE